MDLYKAKISDKVLISSGGRENIYEVGKVTKEQIHIIREGTAIFKFRKKDGVEIAPLYSPHHIRLLSDEDIKAIAHKQEMEKLKHKIEKFFKDQNRLTDDQAKAIASILNIE